MEGEFVAEAVGLTEAVGLGLEYYVRGSLE